MTDVVLHVYDVTNTENEHLNTVIQGLNNVTREIFAGGVFHGAVEAYGHEWSFGFCPAGTGVYRVRPRCNHMYQYRESIPLGRTKLAQHEVENILLQMQQDWAGASYDLVHRNCCHFCEDFAQRIGASEIPGWVNRFAYSAKITLAYTNYAYNWLRSVVDSSSEMMRDSCYASIFRDRVALPNPSAGPSAGQPDSPRSSPVIDRRTFSIPGEASLQVHEQ